MSFCPKCKSEYINGRPTCADCGTQLVESLDEVLEENMDETGWQELLNDSETESTSETNMDNTLESDSDNPEELSEEDTEKKKPERLYAFVSKKEKYNEYLSTGYMFLTFGIGGLILLTLNLLGIIHLYNVSGASAVMFYGVMYALFVIFLFVSVNSFKNSKRLKAESDKEDTFLSDMNVYLLENITLETFNDMEIPESEEELYFHRTEIIKNKLLEKYPDIDHSLLEQIADDTYDRLFQ